MVYRHYLKEKEKIISATCLLRQKYNSIILRTTYACAIILTAVNQYAQKFLATSYFTIYRISLALSRLNEFLGIKRIRKEKIQNYKKIFLSDSAQNHFRVFLISPKERDR